MRQVRDYLKIVDALTEPSNRKLTLVLFMSCMYCVED